MRFRLRTLMIAFAAAPVWIYVAFNVSQFRAGFSGGHFVFSLLLLCGIATALYRLTRTLPEGFAIAVFLSPMIPLGWIFAESFING
jgi:hypothetical protein